MFQALVISRCERFSYESQIRSLLEGTGLPYKGTVLFETFHPPGLIGTADGVPLNIVLTIVSGSTCAPLAGYAVYLWHCDRLGRYSLYSSGATNQNYLRGVQEADANGNVTFTSIFPGCYAGRWPHIHFEVYRSLAAAGSVANKIATSQIALPKAACDSVYATSGYETSVTNLSRVSLATDGIFSDGSSLELATVTGGVSGMTSTLSVAV
jgi:protocatechuate 3,4-dioxygenase beta subunit